VKLTAKQKDNMILAAQNALTFTVTGRGAFPMDMLRYDICWPANETMSNLISDAFFHQPHRSTISLKGLKPPTFARWRSFGWEVVDLGDERR